MVGQRVRNDGFGACGRSLTIVTHVSVAHTRHPLGQRACARCIYADVPVCDFKSWPGGKGRGPGDPAEWRLCLQAYGFDEAHALGYAGNPVDQLAPLAEAGVPLLHAVGDADRLVPFEENTGLLVQRYRMLGGDADVIVKHDVGHDPGLADPAGAIEFIAAHTE